MLIFSMTKLSIFIVPMEFEFHLNNYSCLNKKENIFYLNKWSISDIDLIILQKQSI